MESVTVFLKMSDTSFQFPAFEHLWVTEIYNYKMESK